MSTTKISIKKKKEEDVSSNAEIHNNTNNQNMQNIQYQSNQIDDNKGTERDGNMQNKRDINTNFEDENENHSTNNNQGSKWSLYQGCNCSCWPFN